nr:isoform 2 of cullin-9 [Quercus suber]
MPILGSICSDEDFTCSIHDIFQAKCGMERIPDNRSDHMVGPPPQPCTAPLVNSPTVPDESNPSEPLVLWRCCCSASVIVSICGSSMRLCAAPDLNLPSLFAPWDDFWRPAISGPHTKLPVRASQTDRIQGEQHRLRVPSSPLPPNQPRSKSSKRNGISAIVGLLKSEVASAATTNASIKLHKRGESSALVNLLKSEVDSAATTNSSGKLPKHDASSPVASLLKPEVDSATTTNSGGKLLKRDASSSVASLPKTEVDSAATTNFGGKLLKRDASSSVASLPKTEVDSAATTNFGGKLLKRDASSSVASLPKPEVTSAATVDRGIKQAPRPEPIQYCSQGQNLGSVLLASFLKRATDPQGPPDTTSAREHSSDARSDRAGSSQLPFDPPVVSGQIPAEVEHLSSDVAEGESEDGMVQDMIDRDLVSVAELRSGKAVYMAADGSVIGRNRSDFPQRTIDFTERLRWDDLYAARSMDASKPGYEQRSSTLTTQGEYDAVMEGERVLSPLSMASEFHSHPSPNATMHAEPFVPYSTSNLPAIRDLDWNTLDPSDFEHVANAYNDISPADSAVAFLEPTIMPPPLYAGKGKGRAVDARWHEGDPIIFAPRPPLQIPKVAHDHPLTARDHQLDIEKQETEARLRREAEDRVQAEALQARLMKEEEDLRRIAAELAKVREEQRLLEEVRLAAEATKLHDCNVCGDGKPRLDFPAEAPSASCEHQATTCRECLASWMTSELETKGSDGLKCPECPSILQYDDIQRAASPVTFDAYEKLLTRNALAALDDFAWCLNPKCGSGQENPENNNYMDCAACGYKQCLTHKCEWHTNETCTQYEYRTSGQAARDEEAKTEAMLDGISKKCPGPGCGWRIEKISGCDHMTCKRCKFQFCWQCLASHEKIKKDGNTVHEKWCKFHSDNLAVAWPFNAH